MCVVTPSERLPVVARRRSRKAPSVRAGRFADRAEAGTLLAERLERFRNARPVVLGLPRGGVPVAYQVASALDAPLDVIVVRKLGLPSQQELAMGAIGEGGVRVLDHEVLDQSGVGEVGLADIERRERQELLVRLRRYRQGRERADFTGRMALVVDDGVATGSTAMVACRIARLGGASSVVLAVPVVQAESRWLVRETDEVVAVEEPESLVAVGHHYVDFSPTSDDEVIELVDWAAHRYGHERWRAQSPDGDLAGSGR